MNGPSYRSEPQIQLLYQLLGEIAEGHLQIPRFQRPVVWTDDQRLELLRSVRAGTPIGSIIVWRTSALDVKCYDRLGPHLLKAPPQRHLTSYILDGHQRLSTLFGALHPLAEPGPVPASDASYNFYYDLEALDFLLDDRPLPVPTWLPVRFALDTGNLIRFQRTLEGHPSAERLIKAADALSGRLRRYKLPVLPIVTDDLDEVTKTFQRINSPGTPMSEVHMVSALTWSDHFDLSERIAELKEKKLAPIGWGDLDGQVLLRTCKAALGIDVYDADVDVISKALQAQPAVLDDAVDSIVRAAQLLGERCNIKSPRILPYSPPLVLLAEAFRSHPEMSDEAKTGLCRWFWMITYVGYAYGTPKLRLLLEQIQSTDRKEASELAIKLPPALPALSTRYDFRSTRNRTVALRLAELAGNEAVQLLADQGVWAVNHLIVDRARVSGDAFASPANRIIADPKRAPEVRAEIERAAQQGDSAVLERHAIPADAAKALAQEDWERFFKLRLQKLEELENDFAFSMGLIDPPKPGAAVLAMARARRGGARRN